VKRVVRYKPTIPQESMQKIKKLLEKINEDMYNEAYNKPSRPTLRIIRGGKS